MKRIEMNFLPDVSVPCELCAGDRFIPETLSVTWAGKHIGEVLKMSVDEAIEVFSAHPKIHHALELMRAVGLGYVTASPAPIGMLGDFLAAAVNPKVGAWRIGPMATEIELQTVRWVAGPNTDPKRTGPKPNGK